MAKKKKEEPVSPLTAKLKHKSWPKAEQAFAQIKAKGWDSVLDEQRKQLIKALYGLLFQGGISSEQFNQLVYDELPEHQTTKVLDSLGKYLYEACLISGSCLREVRGEQRGDLVIILHRYIQRCEDPRFERILENLLHPSLTAELQALRKRLGEKKETE